MNVFLYLPFRCLSWIIRNRKTLPLHDFLTPITQKFRVMPTDIDINLHMNNARYLSFMDAGRWCFGARMKLWRKFYKMKCLPVVGGSNMWYRRQLKVFEKFTLESYIYSWDDKWFYAVQIFRKMNGQYAAIGVLRTTFVRARQIVPPENLLEMLGVHVQKKPLPETFRHWGDVEQNIESILESELDKILDAINPKKVA